MKKKTPNFPVRLLYSVVVLCRYIFNADFARAVHSAGAEEEVSAVPETKATVVDTLPESALQLLSLLQQEARLVDFVQEDLTGYGDADIGAAARVVHQGCRKVISEHFSLTPVTDAAEQSRVTLAAGFNAADYRLTGNLTGQPPFTGTLVHPGWKVIDTRLPRLVAGHDLTVLAPAEVEL